MCHHSNNLEASPKATESKMALITLVLTTLLEINAHKCTDLKSSEMDVHDWMAFVRV